jgi:hypothetical protein
MEKFIEDRCVLRLCFGKKREFFETSLVDGV